MTISEMLGQSGILTLLGMVVVFSFLIIMIIAMNIMHGILHIFHLDEDKKITDSNSAAADDGEVVAAIAAAIHEQQS